MSVPITDEHRKLAVDWVSQIDAVPGGLGTIELEEFIAQLLADHDAAEVERGITIASNALHRAMLERGVENAAAFFDEYLEEERALAKRDGEPVGRPGKP